MSSVHLGAWRTFPSNGGSTLVFDGKRLAVAGEARLSIWLSDTLIAAAEASAPAPGAPRFVGERVYWGPGYLDLGTGNYSAFEEATPDVAPDGGERPAAYAWSASGDLLVGSFHTGNSNAPTRVALYRGDTSRPLAILHDGAGIPPQSAWVGERALVVGFDPPRVYDRAGKQIATIALDGAVVSALAATRDERRVLAVAQNRAVAWIDAENWTVRDRWHGPWLDAAVSPNGRVVAALQPWGRLHLARIEADRLHPLGTFPAAETAVAVALSDAELATVGGGEFQRAVLTIAAETKRGER